MGATMEGVCHLMHLMNNIFFLYEFINITCVDSLIEINRRGNKLNGVRGGFNKKMTFYFSGITYNTLVPARFPILKAPDILICAFWYNFELLQRCVLCFLIFFVRASLQKIRNGTSRWIRWLRHDYGKQINRNFEISEQTKNSKIECT